MPKLTHQQQERLIRIFNRLGWFPKDKFVQDMTWDEYRRYVRLYHEVKAG